MAGWFKRIRHPAAMPEIKQRGKGQPHPTPLIGDESSAPFAADLARQNSLVEALFAVKKIKVLQPGGEPYMVLVKYGGPLHGCAVQSLTGRAVANFGIHRVGAHFVSNTPAKARGSVSGNKRRVVQGRILGAQWVFHGKHL
jgi:hypothetical protein